ncbi:MAG: hypothetical protein O7D88_08015, partial [Gammaproteobacteria bacterium]|nr:hypothetical protein [Gammaproteobacteria bacterium]
RKNRLESVGTFATGGGSAPGQAGPDAPEIAGYFPPAGGHSFIEDYRCTVATSGPTINPTKKPPAMRKAFHIQRRMWKSVGAAAFTKNLRRDKYQQL